MFTYAFTAPRAVAPVVTEVVSIRSYDLAESPPAIRISVVKTQTWAQCRIFMQGFTHTGIQGLGSTLGTLENVMPVVEVHPRWTKGISSLIPNFMHQGVPWFHATCRMPAVQKPAHKHGIILLQSFSAPGLLPFSPSDVSITPCMRQLCWQSAREPGSFTHTSFHCFHLGDYYFFNFSFFGCSVFQLYICQAAELF